MTKRDFRIRRGLFRQGQISRYRDFNSLHAQYQQKKDRRTVPKVITMILIASALLLLIYLLLSF